MGWQLAPSTVPFAVGAAVSVLVMIPVYRNRDRRGAVPLLGLLFGAFMWSAMPALRSASTTEGAKLFWNNLRFFGPTISSPAAFLFAAEFTNRRQWLTARRVGLLAIPALITVLMAWTNPVHHLLRAETTLQTTGQYVTMEIVYGPFFFAEALYHYVILLVATYWLADEYRRVRRSGTKTYRNQARLLLLAMFAPWIANISFVTGLVAVDVTPFGFTLTGLVFAAGLFRYRLLDILPIARGTVVDSIDHGVIVLDTRGTIIDVNPRARDVIGLSETELIGESFESVFAEYEPIIERFADVRETRDQVSICRNGSEYHYEVKVSPIEDSLGNYIGRTIVFDDITVQVERQRALAAREEELDLMRQVQSRILRHNIPNDLQVVKTNNELLAEELDGERAEMAGQAVSKADDLIMTSAKARTVEHLIDQDQTPTQFDLAATLDNIVETYRNQYPAASFDLDCPETCLVDAVPSLNVVFENLIENAVEHNDAAHPTVGVTVTADAAAVTVAVSDNGPGIPAQELTVLEQREETPLEHGSGMGLWAVNWIIDSSRAAIDFETDSTGTTVIVRIAQSEAD